MKNIISTLIILASISSATAMEVQCNSTWDDILIVLKKSPTSNKSYLLFLGEVELEKYYTLSDSNFIFSSEGFEFSDMDTKINVDFNLSIGQIHSSGPIFRNTSTIALHNCKNIPKEDTNTP